MRCLHCGSEMPAGYTFCTRCGERLYAEAEPRPRVSPAIVILFIILAVSIILAVLLATGVLGLPGGERSGAPAAPTPDLYASTATPSPTEEPPQEVTDLSGTELPETAAAPEPVYLLPDSATRYLTDSDLTQFSWEQLCLARNEIFARHGLIFGVKEIDDYFLAQSWYSPTTNMYDFPFGDLGAIEKANAAMIAKYEERFFGGSYY